MGRVIVTAWRMQLQEEADEAELSSYNIFCTLHIFAREIMAKLEHKVGSAAAKKQKAKKRKHTAPDNDEEVASKSLILAPMEPATKAVTKAETKTKTLKRKNKEKSKIKEKRSKHMEGAEQHAAENEAASEAEEPQYEPTLAELQASENPENVSAVVTVRQKKKQKHKQRLEAHKDQSGEREKQRNEEYLRKWKNARAEWKFEKLRQIAIQQSVFDDQKISSDVWPIALEYLSGTKGAAKDKITKLAEACIDQLDKQCAQQDDDEARQAIVDSTKYQRARDLLQSFD